MSQTKETSNSEQTLAAQVAGIMRMEKKVLVASWRELLGEEPPTLHITLLRQRLAWKVQELALGGLSETAKKRLQQVKMSIHKGKPVTNPKTCQLPAGTRLMREFNGEEHEVIVTQQGFEYRGETYKSLTRIARAISGTHWSGPAFFGLRKKKKGKRP